jgi:4-azaleucine resistance transporter AzlC
MAAAVTAAPSYTVRDGVRRVAPLAAAVGLFGVTFGVLARDAGLGPVATMFFSITTFAGSAQFAVAAVLSAGGTATAAVLAALLLNSRYVPIGLSVAPWLPGRAPERLARAQLVVDESWAVSHLGGGHYHPRLLLGAGLTLWCAWVAGTGVGLVSGSLLGDPETLGLDAAFPALFVALLAGQARGRRARGAAVLGAVVALALVPVLPVGLPVVAASVVCLWGLRR